MSDDKSDKAGGWFGNPLPIVMVVLLAAGVLVKNVPLESARPTDSERVKFVATSQQDVEARLWQDPFAAVARHENSSDQAITPKEETSPTSHLPEALCKNPLLTAGAGSAILSSIVDKNSLTSASLVFQL